MLIQVSFPGAHEEKLHHAETGLLYQRKSYIMLKQLTLSTEKLHHAETGVLCQRKSVMLKFFRQ